MANLIDDLSCLIGNTPLLQINYKYKGQQRKIFAKAENLNLTGSIKDRMAFHILRRAINEKKLKQGMPIIEATSGNTGVAFSALGRALGYDVTIFMPDWMSDERKNLIKSFGADIVLISKEEGGFLGSIARSEELAKKLNGFLPCQFSNTDNTDAHYSTTAPEIWWQLKCQNLEPDAFVAGVGTGGTIMGVGKFLKEQNKKIKIHPLEPENSPTLTTGHKVGKHRIQGISDEFIPSIIDFNDLDSVVCVDDGDSIIMAQKLARMGLGVGISSGANFLGAVKLQNEMGKNAVIATVFPDDNKKYLSTDLMRTEPVKSTFFSKDIEIISFKGLKRVCRTCCDPENCKEILISDDSGSYVLPHCIKR